MLFRVNHRDRQSLSSVSSAEAIVVRLFASHEVVGVANVKRAVSTAKEVNPRHSDDDAIVE
jgi:hypothetical protein